MLGTNLNIFRASLVRRKVLLRWDLKSLMAETLAERLDEVGCRLGDHGAGREDRLRAGALERIIILRRDDAADHDHDVGPALSLKLRLKFRNQLQGGGGRRGNAEDVDVVLDRLARRFRRRCE